MQFNILKVLDDMCIFSDINIVISVISMCLISFYVIFPHFYFSRFALASMFIYPDLSPPSSVLFLSLRAMLKAVQC